MESMRGELVEGKGTELTREGGLEGAWRLQRRGEGGAKGVELRKDCGPVLSSLRYSTRINKNICYL